MGRNLPGMASKVFDEIVIQKLVEHSTLQLPKSFFNKEKQFGQETFNVES